MTSRGPFRPGLFYDSLIPSSTFYRRHRGTLYSGLLPDELKGIAAPLEMPFCKVQRATCKLPSQVLLE